MVFKRKDWEGNDDNKIAFIGSVHICFVDIGNRKEVKGYRIFEEEGFICGTIWF